MKAAGIAVVAMFLGIVVGKQNKELALVLTVTACSIVLIAAIQQYEQVVRFVEALQSIGQLDNGLLEIILKVVGIGLLSEVTNMLCVDAGNAAFGKTFQMLATCVILCLSLPLFDTLLELIEEILEFV